MEAAQQRTGWPIGRKKRQESGGRLGATPENTGMLGQTEATCKLQSAQPSPRVKQLTVTVTLTGGPHVNVLGLSPLTCSAIPVEGVVGGSGTAAHRLANRAKKGAGERRAPGSHPREHGHAWAHGRNMQQGIMVRTSTARNTTAAQGKATKRGKESKKQHPASEGSTKNATAQPAPAQKLVKASRQASNGHGKRKAAPKQAGKGSEDTGGGRTGTGGLGDEGAQGPMKKGVRRPGNMRNKRQEGRRPRSGKQLQARQQQQRKSFTHTHSLWGAAQPARTVSMGSREAASGAGGQPPPLA